MDICFEVTLQFTYITVLGLIQMLSCYIKLQMVYFEGMSSTCQSDSNVNYTAQARTNGEVKLLVPLVLKQVLPKLTYSQKKITCIHSFYFTEAVATEIAIHPQPNNLYVF